MDDQPLLILASASPRRHDLLGRLGLAFRVVATDGEERRDAVPAAVLRRLPPFPLDPDQHPSLLAWRKARAARDEGGPAGAAIILGADTIVVADGDILGKPRDEAHARALLRRLSGRWHRVYTGLVVLPPAAGDAPLFDLVAADVRLAGLSDSEIAEYVATGEPLDKAGAYGIQGVGGRLVEEVRGSFTAVVGLPLPATAALLSQAGLVAPIAVDAAWQRWRGTLAKEPLCMQQSKC